MEAGDAHGNGRSALDGSGGPPRQLGRYRIVAELGRGSTSIVYLAVARRPARVQQALRLEAAPGVRWPRTRRSSRMFLAEARLGARLSHPNVVSTLEIEDGEAQPYIVMEYLDGQSLQQVITTARIAFTPMPLHMHLAAIERRGRGPGIRARRRRVRRARRCDVVHRDVSPHNVFVTFSGLPKVLDFGIAQTADSPNTMLPSAGRAAYMSPEQAAGESVDARSDLVFARRHDVGGRDPQSASGAEAQARRRSCAPSRREACPRRASSALANVAPELQSLVVKATAPDRGDRYSERRARCKRTCRPSCGG